VARDRSGGRKVRGSRITSSRSEKRRDDPGGPAAPGPGEGGDRSTTPYAPDTGPFVETPAVEDVKRRVRTWLSVDRPVHLVGPTGCGKTALSVAVARERDRPVVFLNGDADMATADLVGDHDGQERYSVRDKYVHNVQKSRDVVRDRWVDNPLTVAVREGATLVYNEFSRTKPVANNVLLSVFEEGVLELPGRSGDDRYVEVHPEFRAVLTSNSVEYAGVHEPQDALLDRLVGIHLDYYDAETERAVVAAHVDLPEAAVATVVSIVRALRSAVDVSVGTRTAIVVAEWAAATGRFDESALTTACTEALGSKVPDAEGVRDLRDGVATVVGRELADAPEIDLERPDRRT
jgi:gas vesicle protein GvpN